MEQPRPRRYTDVMQPLQPRFAELDCERAGSDVVTTVGVFVPRRLERYRKLGAVPLTATQLLDVASLQIQMQTRPFVRVKRSARARSICNFTEQHAVYLAPVHDAAVEELGIATHYIIPGAVQSPDRCGRRARPESGSRRWQRRRVRPPRRRT